MGLYIGARTGAALPSGGQLRNVGAWASRTMVRGGQRGKEKVGLVLSLLIGGLKQRARLRRRALWRGRASQLPDSGRALVCRRPSPSSEGAQSVTGKLGIVARGGATGDSGAALGSTLGDASPVGLAGDSGACRLALTLDWMPNCRAPQGGVFEHAGQQSLKEGPTPQGSTTLDALSPCWRHQPCMLTCTPAPQSRPHLSVQLRHEAAQPLGGGAGDLSRPQRGRLLGGQHLRGRGGAAGRVRRLDACRPGRGPA